jgi:hypothetical protein
VTVIVSLPCIQVTAGAADSVEDDPVELADVGGKAGVDDGVEVAAAGVLVPPVPKICAVELSELFTTYVPASL